MKQRFWPTAFVVLVLMAITDFLIHGLLLNAVYVAAIPQMMREQINFPVLFLAYAVMAPLFTWIYAQGYAGGSRVVEGLRYGFALGVFMWMAGGVIRYATEPVPVKLAAYWLVLGTLQFAVLGVAAALVYGRPEVPFNPAQAGQADLKEAA
ncbi:MAG: hypothetical protein HY704_01040 [Gemmatimonadetes bacterium]|nr:hypothetical protein [Gemmatimonadota bacterium]